MNATLRDAGSQGVGSAALGSLSPTTIKVPVQSKDDEPYPLAFLDSFLWGTATAAFQVKGAWNEDAKRSRSGTGSRTPRKSRTAQTGDVAADHYHRPGAGRSGYQSFRAKTYRLSIDWPPPRNLNDGSARSRKTRPPNSCPTSLAGWLRDHREDGRGSVCKGAAAAMGDARSCWESVDLTYEAKM